MAPLLDPAAYAHPVSGIRLIQTHVSWVFLTGEFAYKVKRPVRYAFVDLRSRERRAFFCAEELRLNRRFAPALYLEICPVTRDAGTTRMGGEGEVIDHAVKMRQFPTEDELDQLLSRNALPPEPLARFGRELALRHALCPTAPEISDWGTPPRVRAALLRNLEECLQLAEGLGTDASLEALRQPYTARLDAVAAWLLQRRAAGRVRECHGDLHARNVVRYGGELVAFDCMEFEPAFRWIDVAEEIAFLAMDLRVAGHAEHAQAFLAGYLAESGDYQAARMLRVYGIHRALVRAKVAAIEARSAQSVTRERAAHAEHRRYVEWARGALAPERPRLLLICGLSGSGKTWLAQRLAPALGAFHVRSDIERKRLAGLTEREPSHSGLAQGLYAASMSERTYARLRECAAHLLAGSCTAIIDATFQRREDRATFHELAAELGADLKLLHCHAPAAVLEERVRSRAQRSTDASEADLAVLALQRGRFEPLLPEEGLDVIEVDTCVRDVPESVLAQLSGAGPGR